MYMFGVLLIKFSIVLKELKLSDKERELPDWLFAFHGLIFIIGESYQLSSSSRKNCDRTVPLVVDIKRKIVGRKGDMIIHRVTTEFGCAEAGR